MTSPHDHATAATHGTKSDSPQERTLPLAEGDL